MHAGRRMMLGTIEEELAACRKRFEGVEVGAFVWCCHHEIELEVLTEPPEKRIDYIMHENSSIERARRLYEFRPVLGKLPAELGKARVEWGKAYAEWDKAYDEWDNAYAELGKARVEWGKAYAEWGKACAEWDNASAELGKACAEWNKAYAELDKARAEWDKACDELDKARAEWDKARDELAKAYDEYHVEIHALHVAEVPDTAWNGTSILGGSAAITGRKED